MNMFMEVLWYLIIISLAGLEIGPIHDEMRVLKTRIASLEKSIDPSNDDKNTVLNSLFEVGKVIIFAIGLMVVRRAMSSF